MQLAFKQQCKTLILQHSYVMCLIRESGLTPAMINTESASLVVFCFPLNPSLFRSGETFGHDLPCVRLLFLLPPVYSTMYSAVPLMELHMSLGLASQRLLHSAGLCRYPSSSRGASCLQLYSCSQARRPVLIASFHAALCHMCFKGESLHTDPMCMSSQLLCVLQLLLFPIQCWTSTAAFA